ncbi:VWA domain-containing protein [Phormidium sp. CCY1219]|uniref:VWA domain-containing protein n=1 Tax=Phormidium sp. CCY1219 TaxID=2886104 RepID=UPI002D1EACA8|nr:VWA domain-containing protein [Phormidium sp. CCY1219]MEB3828239.1 VWA domain-containing protein [Phormidium sp. CCY1219]
MDASQYTFGGFLDHLRRDRLPLQLRRNGQPAQWADEALHQWAYQGNPELYALLGVASGVQPEQRLRILYQLLRVSRAGMAKELRRQLDRPIAVLLRILPPDSVLTVFLALRRDRANHKHTAKAILKYILNHPHFEDMARCRRLAVVDSLEHAMGKNVARACAKMLSSSECADPIYLRRHLLRFAREPEWVKQVFPLLYASGPRTPGQGTYQLVHTQYADRMGERRERPKTITATNRGDISATLVHLYRGGTSPQLQQALDRYVEVAARELPVFAGKLAIVLDASASTRGYGEREYCNIAQSMALTLVLQKCCDRAEVFTVGGSGKIPIPEGSSDLASATICALETQPDLVAIVSDGYENLYPSDLARVVATLPQLNLRTPVVFCHSKFTNNDDLSLRQPAPNLPQIEFWHQDDFEEVILSLFSLLSGSHVEAAMQNFLRQKLEALEQRFSSATELAKTA